MPNGLSTLKNYIRPWGIFLKWEATALPGMHCTCGPLGPTGRHDPVRPPVWRGRRVEETFFTGSKVIWGLPEWSDREVKSRRIVASGVTVTDENFATLTNSYFNQFGPKWCFSKLWSPVSVPNALMDKNSFYELVSLWPNLQFIRNNPVCKLSVLGPRSSAAKITIYCWHLSEDEMNSCPVPTVQALKAGGALCFPGLAYNAVQNIEHTFCAKRCRTPFTNWNPDGLPAALQGVGSAPGSSSAVCECCLVL